MKTSIIIVTALLCASTLNAQKKIKGNGNVTSIVRTTSDYNGVKFAGPFDYVLVSGTEGKIQLEGEENLLPHIVTEVKDGQLIIKTENKVTLHTTRNHTIKITVPFKDITSASLSGSGNLWTDATIISDTFKISVAGSGEATLDVEASIIDAKVAGSGGLKLKGKTTDLEVSIAGSGEFKGFDLNANNTIVSVSGSGDAEIVSHGNLKARVAGSGNIRYKGNPENEDTKVAGSGSISN